MPDFTFTTGRPAGNLTPAQNRPSMQTNNDNTAQILNVDLIGFNDPNGGFHQKSTYIDQASDPGSAALQVVEYSKSVVYPSSAGTFSELFFQRDSVSTPVQQTTGPSNPIVGANGQCSLPGGMGMKWGTTSVNGSGTVTYTSGGLTAFPTNTLAVVITPQANSRTYNWGNPTATGFTATASSAGGGNFTWIAIGN